jgi:hypothetical protein
MEEAASDTSITLPMVGAQIDLIASHCRDTELMCNDSGNMELAAAASSMVSKLSSYRGKLVTDSVLIANYLDPRFPKPSDPDKLSSLKSLARR